MNHNRDFQNRNLPPFAVFLTELPVLICYFLVEVWCWF